MKNLLIIGGGKAAQMRAEINRTHDLFKIHGLVTRSPALSKTLRDQSYQVFGSLGELDQSALDSIDGYWIAQADQDHFETLKQVIPHRKPIYIEKPLTDSLQKTIQIIQMSKEFNTPIHLGYQRRHSPSLLQVYSDIQKTGFNHLQFTERDLPHSSPASLTQCGCIITNFGCHSVNQFLWYTNGKMPHKVQANGGSYYGTGVVDRVDYMLWFYDKNPQGLLVEKSAGFSLSRQSTTGVYENLVEVITGDTLRTYGQDAGKPQDWAERYRSAFTEEMRVFKEVLESKAPGSVAPKTPLEDEVKAGKIMEALVKSYYTQRTVFLDKNGIFFWVRKIRHCR
jgi:myo-inositol 2-dehydrogenase/D-chiro-inositol 1-dehydrogenase